MEYGYNQNMEAGVHLRAHTNDFILGFLRSNMKLRIPESLDEN